MSCTTRRSGRDLEADKDAGHAAPDSEFGDAALEALDGACLAMSMRIAMRRLTRLYDDAVSAHDLTIGQFGLLGLLVDSQNDSIREFAARAMLDETALSRGLAPLVRRGLVDVSPDENDGRRRVVSLSKAGRQLFDSAAPSWRAAQERARTRIGSDRFERLKRDLNALAKVVESDEDP